MKMRINTEICHLVQNLATCFGEAVSPAGAARGLAQALGKFWQHGLEALGERVFVGVWVLGYFAAVCQFFCF